ncbi:MAG: hypothetical protein ACOC9Q_00300 [bacterium]
MIEVFPSRWFRLARGILMKRQGGGLSAALLLLLATGVQAQSVTIQADQVQTAVLDPAEWDESFAGERYFDALRPMLVRFPGVAEQVFDKLEQGYEIESAHLVLNWRKQEGKQPQRGRSGWGAEQAYENDPGQWHAVAWVMKRPWGTEDAERAPTFNAYVPGLGYWDHGGGQGEDTDRLPEPSDPVLLTKDSPVAKLDVTDAFAAPALGDTPGQRLRAIEANGFQVRKHELFDLKYLRGNAGYDWIVSTGYMRIWVDEPKLVLTLRRASDASPGSLPAEKTIQEVAETLREKGGEGEPSIAYPENYEEKAAAHWQQPENMPDWQWERINDLMDVTRGRLTDNTLALGRGFNYAALFDGDKQTYLDAMRELLAMPPRHWQGHLTTDFAILPTAFPDLLPEGVKDHLKLYWQAWLHPEMSDITPLKVGVPSYFRGYANSRGTMNFELNAMMGTLLGSQLIDAAVPLDVASKGLNNKARSRYGLGSGAHQEIGDTYYQSITLAGVQAAARFAEDPVDKLTARIFRDRLVEPLISMYHPGLRRMTHPMARGHYRYDLLMQSGGYQVLHTFSPSGAMLHLDDVDATRGGDPRNWGKVHGLEIMDAEAPPHRFAVLSPWNEPYLADALAVVTDKKSFPWRVHAVDRSPGSLDYGHHVDYLSEHYALASRDNASLHYGVTSIVASWRRDEQQVDHLDDLSQMLIGFGTNERYAQSGLSMHEFGVVQHDNKLIAIKRLPPKDRIEQNDQGDIHSMHATAMVIALGDTSDRELWIGDERIDDLSGHTPHPEDEAINWKYASAKNGPSAQADYGEAITLRDGVTYTALIPIMTNPLAHDREVVVSYEAPFLMVHNFIYDDAETPLNLDELYAKKAKPAAGFILEMGDATQYDSFEAFRRHVQQTEVRGGWNREKGHVDIGYRSGEDTLEMSYNPTKYPAVSRRINGKWPYLGEDLMRESNWAVQGWHDVIEKNGAVLRSDQGSRGYLMAVPEADTYIGYNPIAHAQQWTLETPEGVTVASAGKVSMLRVVVKPEAKKLWIDQVYAADQDPARDDTLARGMHVFGLDSPPVAHVNGERVDQLEQVTVDDEPAYFVPFPIATENESSTP